MKARLPNLLFRLIGYIKTVRTSAAHTHGRYQEISNQDDTSSHTHARTHTHQLMSSIRMQPSLSLIIAQRKLCLSVSNNENTHCSIEYEGKWLAVGINSTTLINSKLSPK